MVIINVDKGYRWMVYEPNNRLFDENFASNFISAHRAAWAAVEEMIAGK